MPNPPDPSFDFKTADSVRLEDFVKVTDEQRAHLDANVVLGLDNPPEGLRWDSFRSLPRPDHVDPRPQTRREAAVCLKEMLRQRSTRYLHLSSFFHDNGIDLSDDVEGQRAAVRLLTRNAQFHSGLSGVLDARLVSLCFDLGFYLTDSTLRRLLLSERVSWGLFDITLRVLGETESRFHYHLKEKGSRQSLLMQAPFSMIKSCLWQAAKRKKRNPSLSRTDLEDLVDVAMSLDKAILIQLGDVEAPD